MNLPQPAAPENTLPVKAKAPGAGRLAFWLKPNATPLPTEPNSDYAGAVSLGMWLLGLGFGGFLLWATLAPLDEGVPAQGVLSVDTKRKRIDHLLGGLVERIVVKEGQKVKKGDELVVLNEVQVKAALNATLNQWRLAAVTVARLQAERDGLKAIVFPSELLAGKSDPDVEAAMRAQQDLFRSRRNALEGELRIIRESARGLEGQLSSLDALKAGREKQIQLFAEQLASFNKLNKQGFISKNQLLELERQLAEVQSRQSEDLSNIGGVNARLAEFRMRDNQRVVEYRREVETQLAEAQRELATQGERLIAMRDSFGRLAIRAPVSGTVVDVAVNTVGGVVKPGERIMDIVPDGEDLIVEAQLPPQYIDRVYTGLPADVHFDAYVSFASRPLVSGKVSVVSADVLTDQRTGVQTYSMRVTIAGEETRKLGRLRLQPGMQCTVMVKTGERSLMTYLLRPFLRRFSTALSEH